MELLTAVLSGPRTLELRVFAGGDFDLSPTFEQRLTKRLCHLMDKHSELWRQ